MLALATSLLGTAAAASRTAATGTRHSDFMAPTTSSAPDTDLRLTAGQMQPVDTDEEVSTTLRVVNLGPGVPSNVTLNDMLPVNVEILAAQPSRGFCTVNQGVSCSLGPLYPHGIATVVVDVRPIEPGRTTAVDASVSSDLSDPDPSNNSVSRSVRVLPDPETTYVTVGDTSMTPSTISIPLGRPVQWNFLGTKNHDVTDTTGMGLYASDSLAPGSYFRYTFDFAGGFSYASTEDSPAFGGTVKLAPVVAPIRGTTSMGFLLRWGTGYYANGFVFDVQLQRPSGGYTHYLRDTTAQSLDFVPDAGNGTYRFRVRERRDGSTEASDYVSSDAVSVDPASPLQWVHQLGGATNTFTNGEAVVVDAGGNTFVTGQTTATLPGSPDANAGYVDMFVAKYDASGDQLWVHELGEGSFDEGLGIALDADGNAYVSGITGGTLPGSLDSHVGAVGTSDVFVVKYDANGNRLWVHELGTSSNDEGLGIAVDADGNAYLTGFTGGTLPGSPDQHVGGNDAFVAKYDSNGDRIWVHELGTRRGDVKGLGVAVDASGSAYVTGVTTARLPGSPQLQAGGDDMFVAKYDTDGNRLWVRQLGTAEADDGFGIAVAADGDPYITGTTAGTLPSSPDANAGGYDVFLAKYDPIGRRLWVHELGTASDEAGRAVAVAADGSAYVAGETSGTLPESQESNAGGDDSFVVKYDGNGSRVWVHELGSDGPDEGLGVAVDSDRAFVVGSAGDTLEGSPDPRAGNSDAFVAEYLSSG
jgi:plastocyanin